MVNQMLSKAMLPVVIVVPGMDLSIQQAMFVCGVLLVWLAARLVSKG